MHYDVIRRRAIAALTLGLIPLLAGCGGSSAPAASRPTATVAPRPPGCVPANTDGQGGPYPAAVSSRCTGLRQVEVDVISDPKIGGGFSPSNITISAGTTVLFVWKSGGHNLHPFQDQIQDTGYTLRRSFPTKGDYSYECQIHPGQNGIIHVV